MGVLFPLLFVVVICIWIKAIRMGFEVKEERKKLLRSLDESIDRATKKLNKKER